MIDSQSGLSSMARHWNHFFFTPKDTSICGLIRIAYAFLMLINVLVLLPDLELWFGEAGVLPFEVSRKITDSETLTVFQWLPSSSLVLWSCYWIFLLQITLLMIGFFSRLQAICVFLWFVSFHHRHYMIFDAQDNVFRLFGFFLIFLPLGCSYSVDRMLQRPLGKNDQQTPIKPIWALRLIQIQVCLIFFAGAWIKLQDQPWVEGTALYYITRLDSFCHFPLPTQLFEQMWAIHLMTWSVLIIEAVVPFAIWFKRTRRSALLLALGLHVAIFYSMNIFLFQWLMLVGWLSFVERHDLTDLAKLLSAIAEAPGRIGNLFRLSRL